MKKYAIVGIGQRAGEFIDSMLSDYAEHARIVALCDCEHGGSGDAGPAISGGWRAALPSTTPTTSTA